MTAENDRLLGSSEAHVPSGQARTNGKRTGKSLEKVEPRRTQRVTPEMPVQYLKGVGPARAKVFAELGVYTVADLLEYFPRDWVFAPKPAKIAQLRPD